MPIWLLIGLVTAAVAFIGRMVWYRAKGNASSNHGA